MQIVTGYEGTPHVTAWQDRDLNQGIFGSGTYILSVGSKMAASIISNNEIRIADGAVVMQGCLGVIQKGTYDTIAIDNGSQGLARHDLICAQYSKNGSTGVESMSLVVIKGTAASSASDPAYTSGDIQNGDSPVQVPIYRVALDGLSISSITRLVDEIGNISDGGGTGVTISGSTSLPSGQGGWTINWNTIRSILLPAGMYIVTAHLQHEEDNAINARLGAGNIIYGGVSATDSEYDNQAAVTAIIDLQNPTTVTIYGQQSAGFATTCNYKITYKKVG